LPDGPAPAYTRDAELYYHATTWPGAKLPHVWLDHAGEQVSTLDVVGKGRFVVLTGIGGEAWVEAAETIAAERGIPLKAYVIGPGRDLVDIFGDWAEAREVTETGAVLVRPDQYVCFRSVSVTATAHADLDAALTQVLGQAG
jgi:2,4-dichlorophenol 6-monooxygenase